MSRIGALIVALSLGRVFAADLPSQNFTYQGKFFNSAGSAPLLSIIDLTLEIYSPGSDGTAANDCLLYAERQSGIDLSLTGGVFSVQVGSVPGAPKRAAAGNDQGLSMAAIFSNKAVVLRAPLSSDCTPGYTPSSGDARKLRVTVTDGGVPTTLTPDQLINAVPQATNAETLQGVDLSNIIQATGNISHTTLGTLVGAGDASSLHHHDSLYLKSASSSNQNLGSGTLYSTGKIGVGTSSPSVSFEVVGPTGAAFRLVDGNQGAGKVLISDATGNATWQSVSSMAGATGASGAQGSSGATGASGADGAVGNSGATGASGSQGNSGATGASGAVGSSGATGASGANGASGADGAVGNTGASGATGALGAVGNSGATGASGAQGSSGATGASGADGALGNSGATGASGADGAVGNTGGSGATGAAGTQGNSGATGASGAQGMSGATGASGTDGAVGSTGASGATGAAGAQGNTGATGATGADGVVGFTGASGAQGDIGATGASGAQGMSGATGATGTQGNTGATGAQGNYGATGVTGGIGSQGNSGVTGATGADGAVGATGATGAFGAQGMSGASGATGDQGEVGNSGATGASGAYGAQGNTGASGTQGSSGNTGSSGATGASGLDGSVGATGATGASPFSLSGSDAYYTAGKVGIGTSIPAAALHVDTTGVTVFDARRSGVSQFKVTSLGTTVQNALTLVDSTSSHGPGSGYQAIIQNDSGHELEIGMSGSTSSSPDVGYIYTTLTEPMVFGTSLTERMRITGTGNVGIGTTAPGAKLHVVGPAGTSFQLVDGNQGAGKILTSDGSGFATWSSAAAVAGASGATGASGVSGVTGAIGSSGATGATGASPFVISGSDVYYPSGSVRVGSAVADANLKFQVDGAAAGAQNVIATGATVNLAQGNVHVLQSPGASAISLQNAVAGASYTIVIEDTMPRMYTFSGCTNAYFSPANGETVNRSIYHLQVVKPGADTNCYVSWLTGFN